MRSSPTVLGLSFEMVISAPIRPKRMGWNKSHARPTMAATGACGPTSISHSDLVPPFKPVCSKVLDTRRILALSAFQLSAAIKAKTRVQRPPAPAKPTTCVKKTENMDKPNNIRVLLTTRSSCGGTKLFKPSFYFFNIANPHHTTLTWSLLGNQHRNRPKISPATMPPTTSSRPFSMFIHVEPVRQTAWSREPQRTSWGEFP